MLTEAPAGFSGITLLAANHETIDDLRSYLGGLGIASHTARSVDSSANVPGSTTALVLFPDGFLPSEVLTAVRKIRGERPTLPIVFVSAAPAWFHQLLLRDGASPAPIVLHKPALGGVILDAIRILSRPDGLGQAEPPTATTFSTEGPESAASRVATALRAQRSLEDAHFDQFLPAALRLVSGQFWTPLDVATRAATWLDGLGVKSVVDIGSGVGKFCIAGALASHCSFVGIEQRGRLVDVAAELACVFGVEDRVDFVEGVFGDVATPAADCYFLFNPFGENLFGPNARLDDEVELSRERHRRDINSVRALARSLAVGTYFLTYNGFGGHLPGHFEEVLVDRDLPAVLRMWRKGEIRRGGERVKEPA